MTKKLFQITRLAALLMTGCVGIGLLTDEKIVLLDGSMYGRCLWQLLCLCLFLVVSFLYENRQKVFSTGYLFLFINVFINGSVCPFFYTNSRLLADERENYFMPPDFYGIYVKIYLAVMLVALVYLLCKKHTTEDIKRWDFLDYEKTDDVAVLLVSFLLILPVMEMTGTAGATLFVPTLCYFVLKVLYTKLDMNTALILGMLGSLYAIYRVRSNRFLVIEYVMPVVMVFLVFVAVNDNRKKGKKVVPLMIAGVIAVFAYGMLSELMKLNQYWGGNYNIWKEITDFSSIIDFAGRQIYRLFGIWTELGGNIMEYVQLNGYFHGLSYIHSIAPMLGLEEVNLPIISARFIMASYAQPGLIAEGYANFGVLGGVLNLLLPFFVAEGCLTLFLRRRDTFSICLLTIPFVKILLDGGTINSVIFGMLSCCATFSLYLLLRWLHVKMHGISLSHIHLFKKKEYLQEETLENYE